MRERSAPQNRLSAETKEGIGSTGVAQERHGLFRCGAFAAACATHIDPKYSGAVCVPPGPNTWTLNIQPLGRFHPHRHFLLDRSTLPQQCGLFATYRRLSCPPVSTICRCIVAHCSGGRRAGLTRAIRRHMQCSKSWWHLGLAIAAAQRTVNTEPLPSRSLR
jgi:hypothetical protein